MKILHMIAAELRRLSSSTMAVVALIALMCVPILYGGLYLWANQDPYAKLSSVPVALVVNDTGAELSGSPRNLGDEAAQQLLDSDIFDWHRVSEADAAAGLDAGTYDFAVVIPADFSSAIASLTGKDPRPADIVLRTNDANNYLASTIGKQAVETIRTTVATKVVKEAGLTMLDALHTVRVGLVDAGDGARQLVDGLTSAQGGSSTLGSGSAQLADGAAQLHDGTGRLASGLDSLSSGARQVADGTARVSAIGDEVSAAAGEAVAELPRVREDLTTALREQGVSEERIAQILGRLDPVGERLDSAASRVQAASGQLDALANGAAQLADGAVQLRDGARSADDGAARLADGTVRLRDGAAQLDQGLAQLHGGAVQLRDGLADGAGKLPDTDDATRRAQADTLGAPVEVSRDSLTEAQNYGAGLAPFFAALAAWIGIYALFLIVKPVSRRAITALRSPIRVTLAGWATPAMLGGLQMLGLFGVLALALGFQFANPLATLGVLVLASATYAAIILALNVWLGSVGQFLGLVLMVLQLVTAGGTFPWQTLPGPLAALHQVLPMGFVVDAQRQLMYGGGLERVGGDLTAMLIWLLGSLVVAAVGVTRMTHTRTLRDLQPSLIG